MHHAFTTGLQATNWKPKCTLLRLVFVRDIFVNRDVCETWERNCKEVGRCLATARPVFSHSCMLFMKTLSGR
jgi:hypothetical protein